MLQIAQTIAQVIGIARFLPWTSTGDNEMQVLEQLKRDELTYSESYKGDKSNGEPMRKIKPGIPDLYGYEQRVLGLRHFGTADKIMPPEEWLDYAIFYSLDKRHAEIEDDDIFIGIALYSQDHPMVDSYKDTLIENLFELYIKKKILCDKNDNLDGNKTSFYDRIYATRDEQELARLEELMKTVLLAVLKKYKLPFSVEDKTGDLKIYKDDPCCLEDWCSKRESTGNEGVTSFSNIVMNRVPSDGISEDERRILLTLIGMVRTGKNIISVKCLYWLGDGDDDFNEVLGLANTNSNLVGVAELNSYMEIDKLLGSLRGQLKYLEIEFMSDNGNYNDYGKIIEFINSLENSIAIEATFHEFSVGSTVQALLDSMKIECILKLRLLSPWNDALAQNMAILGDPKIIGLELYNCDMSLEEFLLDGNFGIFRDKLRVLEVSSVGSLERIAYADLASHRIETLYIGMRDYHMGGELMSLCYFMHSGIMAGEYFKYLVFTGVHNHLHILAIIVDMLRKRTRPIMLTNLEPLGAINMDYLRVCGGCFYELHSRRKRE